MTAACAARVRSRRAHARRHGPQQQTASLHITHAAKARYTTYANAHLRRRHAGAAGAEEVGDDEDDNDSASSISPAPVVAPAASMRPCGGAGAPSGDTDSCVVAAMLWGIEQVDARSYTWQLGG